MRELQKKAYETAKRRGQWEGGEAEAINHLITEVGEYIKAIDAYESYFDGLADVVGFKDAYKMVLEDTKPSELADIVITAMSIAEHKGIDLGKAIELKMRYNEVR